MRQLEIVGEATKGLSAPFRESHPGLPWKGMAGLRDVRIHAYDVMDLEEVGRAIEEDPPAVVAAIGPPSPLRRAPSEGDGQSLNRTRRGGPSNAAAEPPFRAPPEALLRWVSRRPAPPRGSDRA